MQVNGSLRQVLLVSLPLIASSASVAIKLFCDRLMLAQHSETAIQAAMPAGITCFMFMILVMGTASYTQTFVAQYTGAGQTQRSGLATWQGIWIAICGAILLSLNALWSESLFTWAGHAPEVIAAETTYFNILTCCTIFPLLNSTLGTFWGGRGMTRIILGQTALTALINIFINYVLIDGHFGFPSLGIKGAAYGTVCSDAIGTLVLATLFFRKSNREHFGTLPQRTFDYALTKRILRFGLPNGIRCFLDLAAFNMFVLMVGRYGAGLDPNEANPQEAANIAFSINGLAFIPMMGLGQAVSILVGQAIGAQAIPIARKVVRNSLFIGVIYMGSMAIIFLAVPEWLLSFFQRENDPAQLATLAMGVVTLRFLAAWELLDAVWMTITSALQGAGDTTFSLIANTVLAWGGFVVPLLLAVHLNASVWVLWWLLLIWVILGTVIFTLRYHHGAWTQMSVIEDQADPPKPATE